MDVTKVGSTVSDNDMRAVSVRVLGRRLRAIVAADDGPVRLCLHTRSDAPLPYLPDVALQLDWCSFFDGRCATPDRWNQELLPALADIASAIHQTSATRTIVASGKCCLPAAFALGRAFIEPSGLHLTWQQYTEGAVQDWSLRQPRVSCGFGVQTQHIDFEACDAALLINVRGDVEPAVRASSQDVPKFGIVTRVCPESGTYPAGVTTPGQAVDLARLVVTELRRVLTKFPYITRTHIFLSGPVGLGVLIGQQLNGLGTVQTYEHIQEDGQGRYVPAALLTDRLSGETTG